MSSNLPKGPRQKAVRKPQTLKGWMFVIGLMGASFLYGGIQMWLGTRRFNIDFFIVVGIGLILLSIIPLRFLKQLTISNQLEKNGDTSTGKVLDKWVKVVRGEGQPMKTCFVSYEFGSGYGAVQKVNSSVYEKLNPGDDVAVRYLSSDPNRSRLETDLILERKE